MKKLLFSALIIAAVMTSCSKRGVDTPSVQDEKIEVLSGVSAVAKASYSGDVEIIGLQFLRSDVMAPTPPDFSNATAISANRSAVDGEGAITFANEQTYLNTGENTHLAAYFPAANVVAGVATWTIDGSLDIMTAAAKDAGTKATKIRPNMEFRHELTQIAVTFKAETGKDATVVTRWGQITSVKLKNTHPQMTYSYATPATAPAGTLTDIAMLQSDYTTAFAAIDIPASTNSSVNAAGMFVAAPSQTFELEVTTANLGVKTLIINLGENNVLTKGQRHLVTITFKGDPASGDPIEAVSSVQEWTLGAPGTGEFV